MDPDLLRSISHILIQQFLLNQTDSISSGYFRYSHSGDLFPSDYSSNLAGSIFALKLFRMIGQTDPSIIKPITDRILSFQRPDGTFADPFVCRRRLVRQVLSNLKQGHLPSLSNEGYIRAETRQAYSALSLYDVFPEIIHVDIPTSSNNVETFLKQLDWSRPWGAGSHFSHLLFFLSFLHRANKLDEETFLRARQSAVSFVATLQHHTDGAWYTGSPSHRQKVNGAMKIISGLCVDDLAFDHPEKLIDLVLLEPPTQTADACDQINQVLVLRYADKLCNHSYRQTEIEQFCFSLLNIWQGYYYPELGGFSFHKHHANDRYYGAKITEGLDEPDMHGTVLFVWGLSMMNTLIHTKELDFLHEIKS